MSIYTVTFALKEAPYRTDVQVEASNEDEAETEALEELSPSVRRIVEKVIKVEKFD